MLLIVFLFVQLILICFSFENETDCYFRVLYSNGSQSWCLDEECSNHTDIISLENLHCQTNYLSLKFSSYSNYSNFLLSTTSKQIYLSSFFSLGRPNLERLLQIEFLSSLENNKSFQLDQLSLLANSLSNIDTYELNFLGNLSNNNLQLFIDENLFLSNEQQFIDTLRLIFNCSKYERVEWELVKSIQSIPQSPCPQQITLLNHQLNQQKYSFNIIILTSLIAFVSTVILIIIALILYNYHNRDYRFKQKSITDSRIELISTVQRF
ncbi:unnamed protein product [Adineta steineri]|uniref:Transmembrane protein n=1 Tax=Adineta steineri TaxID=433720 RepID=A0A815C6S2_9BILA|nr:unnamed protein product [Adineta steineri]CAF1282040.1 unnamed protein product [Adineta steineri]CAF1564110.1 unnamed protein product [Adineta steineri]CAF1564879.1 unnamed protein product [Adineta steineri]